MDLEELVIFEQLVVFRELVSFEEPVVDTTVALESALICRLMGEAIDILGTPD